MASLHPPLSHVRAKLLKVDAARAVLVGLRDQLCHIVPLRTDEQRREEMRGQPKATCTHKRMAPADRNGDRWSGGRDS